MSETREPEIPEDLTIYHGYTFEYDDYPFGRLFVRSLIERIGRAETREKRLEDTPPSGACMGCHFADMKHRQDCPSLPTEPSRAVFHRIAAVLNAEMAKLADSELDELIAVDTILANWAKWNEMGLLGALSRLADSWKRRRRMGGVS